MTGAEEEAAGAQLLQAMELEKGQEALGHPEGVTIHFQIPAATASAFERAYRLDNEEWTRQGKAAVSFEEWIVVVLALRRNHVLRRALR